MSQEMGRRGQQGQVSHVILTVIFPCVTTENKGMSQEMGRRGQQGQVSHVILTVIFPCVTTENKGMSQEMGRTRAGKSCYINSYLPLCYYRE